MKHRKLVDSRSSGLWKSPVFPRPRRSTEHTLFFPSFLFVRPSRRHSSAREHAGIARFRLLTPLFSAGLALERPVARQLLTSSARVTPFITRARSR